MLTSPIRARALAASCLALPAVFARAGEEPAQADPLTANVALVSQYIFRGLTQTKGKPAIQGGVDYAHSSGFYLGTWLSSISWYAEQNAGTVSAPVPLSSPGPAGAPYLPDKTNSARLEWDLYGGFKQQFAGEWTYDLGAIRYLYPGTFDNLGSYRTPNTTELYGAIGYKWLTLKYSRVVSRYTFSTNDAKGAMYLDLSATVPILESGFTLLLHAGRQTYPNAPNQQYFGNSGGNNSFYSYTDIKVGVTKDWQGFSFGAAWTHAGTKATAPDGETTVYRNAFGTNIGGSRLTLSITKLF